MDFFKDQSSFDGVIHFAALKAVGESVAHPMRYFRNNVTGMINLLDACVQFNVPHFVFSSSCTVYGEPDQLPVDEKAIFKPAESPYGRTKQIGEALLEDVCRLTDIRGVSLRYFNPAGAHESGEIGESPINPPLNLVPIITETAIGKRQEVQVFGDDYETRDGSCVRDYIHVCDLADAHTKALGLLEGEKNFNLEAFNLGTGRGVTVLEAIHAFESVSHQKLSYSITDRREGDISAIYADSVKAEKVLKWKAARGIKSIMSSAWSWEKKRQSV
jgi:UDP-glucose 4-epimerase